MIIFVRHGETVWNREGRVQGHRDSPLTRRGIEQALGAGQAIARAVAGKGALRLVASPLGRAHQTAVLIADALALEPGAIILDERLKEMGFGRWEGALWPEFVAANPPLSELVTTRTGHYAAQGGEDYLAVAARIAGWAEEHDACKEVVVAVGHGFAGKIMRTLYVGQPASAVTAGRERQDAVFRLERGQVEEIGAVPAASA